MGSLTYFSASPKWIKLYEDYRFVEGKVYLAASKWCAHKWWLLHFYNHPIPCSGLLLLKLSWVWEDRVCDGWIQPFLVGGCNDMSRGHWERADPHTRMSCRTLRGWLSVSAPTRALWCLQLLLQPCMGGWQIQLPTSGMGLSSHNWGWTSPHLTELGGSGA